jgi:hypothetical protein
MLWLHVLRMAEIGCAFLAFSQSLIHLEEKHNCIWFSIGVLWYTCAIEETKFLRTSEWEEYIHSSPSYSMTILFQRLENLKPTWSKCKWDAPPLNTWLGTTCLLHGPKNLENSSERLSGVASVNLWFWLLIIRTEPKLSYRTGTRTGTWTQTSICMWLKSVITVPRVHGKNLVQLN